MKSKKEQLGMNPSTASNRLVKDLLFDQLCKLGLNKCHQCGKPMTRDTFSIEHKVPWMHSDAPISLYFDLDNISYSHRDCNSSAARTAKKPSEWNKHLRIESRDGYSWCCACEKHLTIDSFAKNKKKWSGLQSECSDCRSKSRSKK